MRAEDPSFRAIKRLVIDRTLHQYYENKDDQLRDRLDRRLSATGLDGAGYLRLLQSGDAAEWGRLETEITINETFFFRFAEQFASLADTILPSLVAARAPSRRLRIWSAGCSTGAEPYSVAILLHRLLGPALADWSVSILGTDIDEAALRTARIGDYGDWALRSLSAEERRRDFVPIETGSGGRRWSLRPAYRAMVRFEKHNLLDTLRAPTPAADGEGYDLVLCRNVLIYFHQDIVRTLVRRFGASLAEDGWLLLGHAEAIGHVGEDLHPVRLDGTVAWRRSLAALPATAAPPRPAVPAPPLPVPPLPVPPLPVPPLPAPPLPVPPRRLPASAAARPRPSPRAAANRSVAAGPPPVAPAAPAAGTAAAGTATAGTAAGTTPSGTAAGTAPSGTAAGTAAEAIAAVRGLADRGLPDAALAACGTALAQHPLCAELFFYRALLHRALDREADAESDFRRALYLCKPFVMAHYHLGLLLADTDRPGSGRRSVAEAARIARDMPEDATLACGDGMTAGRLLALSRLGWPLPDPASSDRSQAGLASRGGGSQGGTSQGGTSQGGTSQGGTSQGGTSQGGTSQGGGAQDGAARGGAAQDGTSPVGAAQDGAAQSGLSRGGR